MSTSRYEDTIGEHPIDPETAPTIIQAAYAKYLEDLRVTCQQFDQSTREEIWHVLSTQPHPMQVVPL